MSQGKEGDGVEEREGRKKDISSVLANEMEQNVKLPQTRVFGDEEVARLEAGGITLQPDPFNLAVQRLKNGICSCFAELEQFRGTRTVVNQSGIRNEGQS